MSIPEPVYSNMHHQYAAAAPSTANNYRPSSHHEISSQCSYRQADDRKTSSSLAPRRACDSAAFQAPPRSSLSDQTATRQHNNIV